MLWKRIATAAVLLPLLVAATLFGKGHPHAWPFLLFTGVAAVLCAHEFFRMFLPAPRDILAGVLLASGVFLGGALLPCSLALPAVLSCVLLAAFHALPLAEKQEIAINQAHRGYMAMATSVRRFSTSARAAAHMAITDSITARLE